MTVNEQVAERIISLIESGVLKKGERIPSLRSLSEQLNVSVNTVREAYWKLENRMYIEAVPQSGYYVRRPPPSEKTVRDTHPAELDPREVTLCTVYSALKKAENAGKLVQLGLAVLDRSYWPEGKMIRFHQKAMRQCPEEVFDYMISPGYLPLREQISLLGMRSGLKLDPDDIIVTTGCQEALFLSLMAVCRPGDSVVVESPVYYSFLNILDRLGINPIEIPGVEGEGMSLETLRYVMERNPVKAVFSISNHSNPTGTVLSWEKKGRLMDILRAHDVPLIEDDVYGDLTYGDRPETCKSLDPEGRVILCSSFSKTISPGIRMGWVAPGRYYDEVAALKSALDIGSPSLNQIALAIFLREGGYERHLRSICRGLKASTEAVRREILETFPPGTSVSDPGGGFLLWISLPKEYDTMDLYLRALEENILIAPGCLFTRKGGFSHCLRIHSGAWNPRIRAAVSRLGEMLRNPPKKPDHRTVGP